MLTSVRISSPGRHWCLALVVIGALAGAGCGSHSSPTSRAPHAARSRKPQVATRLTLRHSARLPAPVQLPGLARTDDGTMLAVGGLDAQDASRATITRVLPSPSQDVGLLGQAVHDVGTTAIGHTVYGFGGGTAAGPVATITAIDGSGRRVRAAGRLPVAMSDTTAVTVGNTAYVIGGYTGSVSIRSVLAFTPAHRVKVVAALPHPVRYAAAAAIGSKIYVAGGTTGAKSWRDIVAVDPGKRRARIVGRLPRPLAHAAGATLNGIFYVLGGRTDSPSGQQASIWAFNPRTGRVSRAGRLPIALSDLAAVAAGPDLVVVGGRDRAGRVHAERWTLAPASPGRQPTHARTAARIPPLLDPHDVYAADGPGRLAKAAHGVPARVYVPNSRSNTVDVIDQRSARIVAHFAVGRLPQHVTPSWDLRTLWVTNDASNTLTPVDPRTSRPGRPVPVLDPYNMYFTADGSRAIVVAEAHRELDFREPHTMALRHALRVPTCAGVDHMDFTADGRQALVSCEFAGRMIVVDLFRERVTKTIDLRPGAMPQDVKLSPDGRTFYVADMMDGGVWLIDARRMRKLRFERTGRGAHGLYPSRDARTLYVSNRGEGSITLISFRSRRPFREWRLPGGGSPDMGGVSSDGRVLWLSGRYDGEVYAVSTRTGRLLHRVKVGNGPHGMAVWPQPGRYSIGHTGVMR